MRTTLSDAAAGFGRSRYSLGGMARDGGDVTVVGGGVIGLFSALELARRGARVTLLERGEIGRGASYGNAGLLVPSYSRPLANPSSIGEGIRALMGRSPALALRPRADPRFAAWLARFLVACRPSRARRTARLLHALTTASVGRYRHLMEGELGEQAGFRGSGWLYVYSSEDALAGGVAEAGEAARLGSRWERLGPAEVRDLEPALRHQLAGAVLYPDDCIVRPDAMVPALARIAAAEGVDIRTGAQVLGFDTEGERVTAVRTADGTLPTGAVVVACGVHTPGVVAALGARLPIEPAKGYSITFRSAAGAPSIPLNLIAA
jgi:D-amino-acid dehydrogenase